MTRAWPIVLSLSVAVLSAYGCDKETPEDKLETSIDGYEEGINRQVDVFCDCYEEFSFGGTTYANKGDCKDGLGEILPARRRCLNDAFLQDTSASQQWMDCIVPLIDEYADCLDSKLSCDDADSPGPCNEDFELGEKQCISLPQSVERDRADCFG